MEDRFGRTIEVVGNKYVCGGLEVVTETEDQALNTFNAMAPEGWAEPSPES